MSPWHRWLSGEACWNKNFRLVLPANRFANAIACCQRNSLADRFLADRLRVACEKKGRLDE